MKTALACMLSLFIGAVVTWMALKQPVLSEDEQSAMMTLVSLKAINSKGGPYSRSDLDLGEQAKKLPDSAFSKKLRAIAMSALFVTDEARAKEFVEECDGFIAVYSHMAAK